MLMKVFKLILYLLLQIKTKRYEAILGALSVRQCISETSFHGGLERTSKSHAEGGGHSTDRVVG